MRARRGLLKRTTVSSHSTNTYKQLYYEADDNIWSHSKLCPGSKNDLAKRQVLPTASVGWGTEVKSRLCKRPREALHEQILADPSFSSFFTTLCFSPSAILLKPKPLFQAVDWQSLLLSSPDAPTLFFPPGETSSHSLPQALVKQPFHWGTCPGNL